MKPSWRLSQLTWTLPAQKMTCGSHDMLQQTLCQRRRGVLCRPLTKVPNEQPHVVLRLQ